MTQNATKAHVAIRLWLFAALLAALPLTAGAQEAKSEGPTQYIPPPDENLRPALFGGFTLSADLLGPAMMVLGDYGSAEAALRLNLLNTYLPVVEAGYGRCDTYCKNTDITYKTSAPYIRAGIDINLLKNKLQDNRLTLGARYGLTRYDFDISTPAQTDPVWGGTERHNATGIAATSQWLEVVLGVQVKVWRNLHMGWSVRYKHELSTTENNYAHPYYIPGYGTTTTGTTWAGTYTLVFDLNWGKPRAKTTKVQ